MLTGFWYSFPVQLLVLHAKKNQWLLLCWLILFGCVAGGYGRIFGIPYLFTDPEYNHRISFAGLFIMGVALGGFVMAFHITCYILDAHRFSFLGNEKDPFTKFCFNNSPIPLAFLVTYLVCFIRSQLENELENVSPILWQSLGLVLGCALMVALMALYFTSTNKDIFKVLAGSVHAPFRRRKITRVNVMRKVEQVRNSRIRVDYFLTSRLGIRKAEGQLFDLSAALQVLRQNHQNAFIINCFVFLLVMGLGIYSDRPGFQVPAGASILLLFTLGVLFAGAMNFWLRRWAGTALVGLLLVLNLLVKYQVIQSDYAAFGLDYTTGKAAYDVSTLTQLSATELVQADTDSTRAILDRWRARFPAGSKPRMILVCTSGGGQRAALWTLRALQVTDGMLDGRLMQHTVLMTGASGGAVGASYFRELYLRRQSDPSVYPHSEAYLRNMGFDNLNAIAFTMVVNDLLFKFGRFTYNGHRYVKDRGYAFEQQLNGNTEGVLDKPLIAYREPERLARIPMLVLAPTIVNDGRKLYISPQPLSYMSAPLPTLGSTEGQKIKGVEFRRFFAAQGADSLRFLSALRMNATFPYITPNVSLPSTPAMEIMDAGLSDNFGVSDAVRFLYVFRHWIEQNTSGVILLSIRDTPKEDLIEKNTDQSLWDKVSTPVGSLYRNWSHLQDIQNDNSVQYAGRWLAVPLLQADLTYDAAAPVAATDPTAEAPNGRKGQRASLSWRLTEREKAGIRQAIHNDPNQATIRQLQAWLEQNPGQPEIQLTNKTVVH
jgi:hypothetical protein